MERDDRDQQLLMTLLQSAAGNEACAEALDHETFWAVVRLKLGQPTVEPPAPVLNA